MLIEQASIMLRRGKIVEGRVAKIFKERALLEQPFIKDNAKTVGEHIKATVAAIGENIQVGSAAVSAPVYLCQLAPGPVCTLC